MAHCRVRGIGSPLEGDPEIPALWSVRDIRAMAGTKFLRAPSGTSTVLERGAAARADLTPIAPIFTHRPHPIEKAWAKAWIKVNVPQLGYGRSEQTMRTVSWPGSQPPVPNLVEIDANKKGTLSGEVRATRGAVNRSNFCASDAGMNNALRSTEVQIVESTAPPEGVSRPGAPPLPAPCQAEFAAASKRVRELPCAKRIPVKACSTGPARSW